MHRPFLFTRHRALGLGTWLHRRLAWLVCSGLLWSLGWALSLTHSMPAHAASLSPVPALVQQEARAPFQAEASAALLSSCSDLQAQAACLDAEAGSFADQDFLRSAWLPLGAAQLLRPQGLLATVKPTGVQPLLRPPRSQG